MDTLAYEAIIGAILPPVIDLINRFITNEKARYIVSLLICVLVGIGLNLNNLSTANVLLSASLVFASAQTVYATYWRKSELRTNIVPEKTLDARKE